MDVTEELLPGRGSLYEFVTHEGVRVSIHVARDGGSELFLHSDDDPDTSRSLLRLDSGEARTVAAILAARR